MYGESRVNSRRPTELSKRYIEALRAGDIDNGESLTKQEFDADGVKHDTSGVRRKFDFIFWSTVVANVILLTMWIYDLRIQLVERKVLFKNSSKAVYLSEACEVNLEHSR